MMTHDTPLSGHLVDLLPSYVNGTASEATRTAIKAALAGDAQLRAALAWHEALAEKVIADVEAAPADIGWSQLQARVRAGSHQRGVRAARQTSVWAKVGRWIDAWLPHRWLSAPALSGVCAALMAVVVGQGVYMSQSAQEADYSAVRGTAPAGEVLALDGQTLAQAQGLSDSGFVRLNFKAGVSERDLRLLLVRSGAVIVAGPGQLGDYTVAVPAAELQDALRAFKDSLLTEAAQEVAAPLARANTSGSTGASPVGSNR